MKKWILVGCLLGLAGCVTPKPVEVGITCTADQASCQFAAICLALGRDFAVNEVGFVRFDLTNATWGRELLSNDVSVEGSPAVTLADGGQADDTYATFEFYASPASIPATARVSFNPGTINPVPGADVSMNYALYLEADDTTAQHNAAAEIAGLLLDDGEKATGDMRACSGCTACALEFSVGSSCTTLEDVVVINSPRFIRLGLTNATWGQPLQNSSVTVSGDTYVILAAGGVVGDSWAVFEVNTSSAPLPIGAQVTFSPGVLRLTGPGDVILEYSSHEFAVQTLPEQNPVPQKSGHLVDFRDDPTAPLGGVEACP